MASTVTIRKMIGEYGEAMRLAGRAREYAESFQGDAEYKRVDQAAARMEKRAAHFLARIEALLGVGVEAPTCYPPEGETLATAGRCDVCGVPSGPCRDHQGRAIDVLVHAAGNRFFRADV